MADYNSLTTGPLALPGLGDFFTNTEGNDLFSNIGNGIGYTGNIFSDWQMGSTGLEGENFGANDNMSLGRYLTPEFQKQLQNYQFSRGQNGDDYTVGVYGKNGKSYGTYNYGSKDSAFDQFAYMAIPAVLGGSWASALGGALGGGILGNSLGGGLTSGVLSAGQGGDFGKGFLSGAIGGGISGSNPASFLGLDKISPYLTKAINGVVGGVASGVAGGKDFGDALKGSVTSAATSTGANMAGDFFGSFLNDWLNPNPIQQMPPNITGNPANLSSNARMNASYGPDYTPPGASILQQAGLDNYQQSFAPPNSPVQSDLTTALNNDFLTTNSDVAPRSGFSLPDKQQLGKFLQNNGGNLLTMLYGLYQNNKNKSAISDQMGGLQGMYGQNSAYAQELRNKLAAQAAARGTRANTAGREVQLQAALADKSATLAPAMMQLTQAQNAARNNQMNILLGGMRNMKGLGDLFGFGGG